MVSVATLAAQRQLPWRSFVRSPERGQMAYTHTIANSSNDIVDIKASLQNRQHQLRPVVSQGWFILSELRYSRYLSFTFSIDNHNMTVIEADGVSTQPVVVDSLVIYAAQRYSVVVKMDQAVDNYCSFFCLSPCMSFLRVSIPRDSCKSISRKYRLRRRNQFRHFAL